MFNFESITPQFDVSCWASEGATDKFFLDFSSSKLELKQKVFTELKESNTFRCVIHFSSNTLWVSVAPGYDVLQVMERICTTLEMQNYKIERKLFPLKSTEGKIMQSFLLA